MVTLTTQTHAAQALLGIGGHQSHASSELLTCFQARLMYKLIRQLHIWRRLRSFHLSRYIRISFLASLPAPHSFSGARPACPHRPFEGGVNHGLRQLTSPFVLYCPRHRARQVFDEHVGDTQSSTPSNMPPSALSSIRRARQVSDEHIVEHATEHAAGHDLELALELTSSTPSRFGQDQSIHHVRSTAFVRSPAAAVDVTECVCVVHPSSPVCDEVCVCGRPLDSRRSRPRPLPRR